ncbi:WD40-repeat-containing domain protein [Lactarius akahatsu]|uniref:WD40-repeat-containing domain protein n=1 Tax=Lactarius akahatsu TaxID=416441 RepID=A0AAD4L510_9AGAM|nr:WD40-repeat-containing domain protein [Lactarius akahatsu]
MGHYSLKKTIQKHHDSVNTLAFSYDGSLFASGADDGLIIVFHGNGSGREVRQFQVKAPVMTLLWHSRFGHTLVAGDASGDVHTLNLDGSTALLGKESSVFQTLLSFQSSMGSSQNPFHVSLHFLGGGDLLLATYMDHGVIGCSAVSSNGKVLAVTNLYDGIDWYSLNSNHFMDALFQYTTHHTIPDNVILPITFVHGNTAVLSGTSYGCARITTVKERTLAESLRHDSSEDIVQALAYTSQGDFRQIVTGVAERGGDTEIQMLVPTIVIITCSIAILLAATQWDRITSFTNWSEDWTRAAEASETIGTGTEEGWVEDV